MQYLHELIVHYSFCNVYISITVGSCGKYEMCSRAFVDENDCEEDGEGLLDISKPTGKETY